MPLRYEAKADVVKIYEDRIQDLIKHFKASAAADLAGSGAPWLQFGDSLKPFDNDHPTELFDRAKANEMFVEATTIKDEVTGAVGDQIVSLRQIEYLAAMERAYRNRHHATPIRAAAHRTATAKGFGENGGVIGMLHLDELRVLAKATKAKKDA